MSSEIARIVERTYRQEIGLPAAWGPEQALEFLHRETTRLALLVAEMAAEMGAAAIAAWEQRTGHAPDYLTTVGLVNTALNLTRSEGPAEERSGESDKNNGGTSSTAI